MRAVAKEVIVVRAGVAVERGTTGQIFDNPQTDDTKALIAAAFNLQAGPESVVGQ